MATSIKYQNLSLQLLVLSDCAKRFFCFLPILTAVPVQQVYKKELVERYLEQLRLHQYIGLEM
jgi:uncharacterized protein YpbB